MKNLYLLYLITLAIVCTALIGGCLSSDGSNKTPQQTAPPQTTQQQNTGQQQTPEQQHETSQNEEKFERPVLPPANETPSNPKEPVSGDISTTPCANDPNPMNCLRDLALKTGDTTYCEKLSTGDVVDPRGVCIKDVSVSKKDVSVCDKLSGDKKNECIKDVSIAMNDVSLCDKISTISIKDYCFHAIAVNKKDRSLCDQIRDELRREKCISQAS